MGFSNFGQPVTIPVPPAAQIGSLQQFLQRAQNQAKSSTVSISV